MYDFATDPIWISLYVYEENFVFFIISAPCWLEENCLQCVFSYQALTESSAWSSPADGASGSSVQWWSPPRTTYGWDIVLYIRNAKICNVPKIGKRNSQKGNCAASVPISTYIYMWAFYTFSRSFCLFSCRKIGGPILEYCMNGSQMYECGNWEQGRAVWFLEKHNSNLLCSAYTLYYIIRKLDPWIYLLANLQGQKHKLVFLSFVKFAKISLIFFFFSPK